LLNEVTIFLRFLFCGRDNGLGTFGGRPANAQVSSDVVAGIARVGPLTFRHCGRMTEVRTASLALPSLAALQRLDGPFQRNDLARQKIFAGEILVSLAAGGLEEVDNGNRNFCPAELPASFQAALSGNEPTLGRNDSRM